MKVWQILLCPLNVVLVPKEKTQSLQTRRGRGKERERGGRGRGRERRGEGRQRGRQVERKGGGVEEWRDRRSGRGREAEAEGRGGGGRGEGRRIKRYSNSSKSQLKKQYR